MVITPVVINALTLRGRLPTINVLYMP